MQAIKEKTGGLYEVFDEEALSAVEQAEFVGVVLDDMVDSLEPYCLVLDSQNIRAVVRELRASHYNIRYRVMVRDCPTRPCRFAYLFPR